MMAHPEWLLLWLAALALETGAAIAWWPAYFRFGLPVWRSSFPLPAAVVDLPWVSTLEHDSRSAVTGNFVFKRLSDSEIAFREAEVGYTLITYLPAMHGLLRLLPAERRGEVVGYATFSTPLAIGLVVAAAPPERRLLAVPILALFLWVIPYVFQHFRYRKVRRLVDDYAAACVMAVAGTPRKT